MSAPTVAITTLGCRLNQVDSQDLTARLTERGFRAVPFDTPADVVIVNTCAVTGRAEASDRQAIHRAARQHPAARIVVTGCWAQVDPRGVGAIRGVHAVVGNADKDRMPELVGRLLTARAPRASVREVSDIAAVTTMAPPPHARPTGRARAFLKVQEGCQHRCAFCIVPAARGTSRSLAPALVLDQARRLIALGHREIVLTGVDLGHYGADLRPRGTLAALLREMAELPGLRWIRLASVLPAYVTPALLEVVAGSPVIAPHLHLPLQSGSDAILRRMRRPYTAAMYRRLVDRVVAAVPRLGLGADVIVGFPDETEDDFASTVRLVEALPFSYLHVFAYSDRRGTEAARLRDHVHPRTIARRSAELRALADAKNRSFREGLVGDRRDALVLERRDRATGALVGLTDNGVEVTFDGPDALMRSITRLRITEAGERRARGEVAA